MNPVFEQIVNIYKNIPLPRKIIMGVVIVLVIITFVSMFFFANKIDYQPLYSQLSAEDASSIVNKLKEERIPYRLAKNGTAIMVPADKVYDIRLSLASAGLPQKSGVGYEIFDKTDFGTTEFVQKLNYQRALQGELARTIKEFEEVDDAKVMIVMPKDSVFIEETKPPSASVLLKLKSEIDKGKIDAVVHLVASSIEDLKPELVTVVDTTGRVLFKSMSEEEKAGLVASNQLQYKNRIEQNLGSRIESMLERIVGKDHAIVRVTSEMDFEQVDVSEEIYDPDVQVVRSRKNILESDEKRYVPIEEVSSVNPVVPPGENRSNEILEKSQKQNDTVNYEISKTIRRTVKPVAVLQRLSVAAVIDGNYSYKEDENGNKVRTYVPRDDAEMEQFKKIVEKAMGYNEDRGDQVTVESFPFSSIEDIAGVEEKLTWNTIRKTYGRTIANLLLIVILFMFIIRPILKTIQDIKTSVEESQISSEFEDEMGMLPGAEGTESLPEPHEMTPSEKAAHYANEDIAKSANIIRNWLSEVES